MFFQPKKLKSLKFNYLNALVFPRPIGWISSISDKGIINLAPYSFFNAVSYIPPQVMFAATANHNKGGLKDTVSNILSTKEFVVNLATKKLSKKVNLSSIDAPHNIDEFKLCNLRKQNAKIVKPPLIKESPINLECRLIKKINLKSEITNKNENKMIIGEVVGIHIDNKFIKNGKINSLAMKAIGRMGYSEYSIIDNTFSMNRPKWNE